jgi:hypothetical protein
LLSALADAYGKSVSEELERQIALLRQELARFPDKRVHHRLAEALLAAGRPYEALTIADQGLAAQPRYLACQQVKGQALVAVGRWTEAVETLTAVVQRVDSPEAQRQLAVALFGAGRDGEGRALCEQLLKRDPLDAEARRLHSIGRAALPKPIAADAAPPATLAPERPAPTPSIAAPAAPPAPAAPEGPAPVVTPEEPGLPDLTAAETEKLVDDFFGSLAEEHPAPAAERPPPKPPPATTRPPGEADLDEIDVFGDQPKPREPASADSSPAAVSPRSAAESEPEQQAPPNPPGGEGFLKKIQFWKSRRMRKE